MQVLPLFEKVQVCLIANEQLVTAITHVDSRGVDFVAVAKMDAVKVATYHHCDGVGGTARQ